MNWLYANLQLGPLGHDSEKSSYPPAIKRGNRKAPQNGGFNRTIMCKWVF